MRQVGVWRTSQLLGVVHNPDGWEVEAMSTGRSHQQTAHATCEGLGVQNIQWLDVRWERDVGISSAHAPGGSMVQYW